ncbi:hypothetical protein J6590_029783 [Homalodisca vitripennis]|nr:hypothetical protein J6590_029783 [Homalodisca vitripennis]
MIQRVALPPATIIRSRYLRFSSTTNRSQLSICLTESGKEFHNLQAVMVKDRLQVVVLSNGVLRLSAPDRVFLSDRYCMLYTLSNAISVFAGTLLAEWLSVPVHCIIILSVTGNMFGFILILYVGFAAGLGISGLLPVPEPKLNNEMISCVMDIIDKYALLKTVVFYTEEEEDSSLWDRTI